MQPLAQILVDALARGLSAASYPPVIRFQMALAIIEKPEGITLEFFRSRSDAPEYITNTRGATRKQ